MTDDIIRRFRNDLAEAGKEHTPQQVTEMCKNAEELFELSYSAYMRYKTLDDEDIRRMAQSTGNTFEYTKNVVEIVLYIGELKYETN